MDILKQPIILWGHKISKDTIEYFGVKVMVAPGLNLLDAIYHKPVKCIIINSTDPKDSRIGTVVEIGYYQLNHSLQNDYTITRYKHDTEALKILPENRIIPVFN